MKLLSLLSILVLICSLRIIIAVDEKDVKVLTDKNFADTIKGSKFALVR